MNVVYSFVFVNYFIYIVVGVELDFRCCGEDFYGVFVNGVLDFGGDVEFIFE